MWSGALSLSLSVSRLWIPFPALLDALRWSPSPANGKGNEKRRTRDRLLLGRANSSSASVSTTSPPPPLPARAHPLPIPLGCLAKFLNWILWRPKTPTRAGHVNWQLPSGRPFLFTFLSLLPLPSSATHLHVVLRPMFVHSTHDQKNQRVGTISNFAY